MRATAPMVVYMPGWARMATPPAARMAAPSKEIGAHSYLEKGTGLDDIRAAIHAAARDRSAS